MQQIKISVRLVQFAHPLVDGLVEETGTEPTDEELRNVLRIAVMIWNAQVMEQVGKGSKYADEARRLLSSMPGPTAGAALIQSLLDRKTKLFPDDLRYIGNFEVYRNDTGELRGQPEARLEAGLWDEHRRTWSMMWSVTGSTRERCSVPSLVRNASDCTRRRRRTSAPFSPTEPARFRGQ